MTYNEASNIVREHTKCRQEYLDNKLPQDVIYWAIKIKHGISAARQWRLDTMGEFS